MDPEIRNLERERIPSDLILVYLAFEPLRKLLPLLQGVPARRFHVYSRVPDPVEYGNVRLFPISRPRFLADLRQCAGVIANAGFTLASECLHLGIPLLAKPIRGQIEQESNALALENLGLAAVTRDFSRHDLSNWLEQPAPPAQRYPDVTAAIVHWLHAGAVEPLAALSDRIWAEAAR